MKSCKLLIGAFTTGALLFGGALFAQEQPSSYSTDIQTPKGEVLINSEPAKAPAVGSAPSFEQLSGGGKSISEAQVEAYPPLANDFTYADSNRDVKISKAGYQRWLKQL